MAGPKNLSDIHPDNLEVLLPPQHLDDIHPDNIEHLQSNPNEVSQGEAALRGAVNQLGIAPYATAVAEHPIGALKTLQGLLEQDVSSDPDVQAYYKTRDDSKAAYKSAYDQWPKTSLAANIAAPAIASLGVSPLLQALGIGGASALAAGDIGTDAGNLATAFGQIMPSSILASKSVINGAKLGAGMGAVGGFTGSNTDLAKGKPLDLASDVGSGAGTGLLAGAATAGLVNKFLGAGTSLDEGADTLATQTVGFPKKVRTKLLDKDQFDNTGKVLRENGILDGVPSTETMLDRTKELRETIGQKIGSLLGTMDESFDNPEIQGKFLNPSDVADKIEAQLITPIKTEPALMENVPAIQKIVDSIAKRGNNPITFQDAQKLKQIISKNWDQLSPEAKQAVDIFNNSMEEAADNVGTSINNPELLSQYQNAKEIYGIAKKTVVALVAKQSQELANPGKYISKTEGIGGLIGAALGHNPLYAIPGYLAGKAIDTANTRSGQLGVATRATAADVLRSVNQALTSSPEYLQQMSQSLGSSSSDAAQKLGRLLGWAGSKVGDQVGLNAIIYQIMENPVYRDLLQKEHQNSSSSGDVK